MKWKCWDEVSKGGGLSSVFEEFSESSVHVGSLFLVFLDEKWSQGAGIPLRRVEKVETRLGFGFTAR